MAIVKYEQGSEESINFKKTKVEEYLDIDETLAELEKTSSVIRLEMNSIELPLFSKDPKRTKNQIKVYHFKTDKSSYLQVEAPADYAIPGEFEERVFIALTKIMKTHNYNKTFVVTANEILLNLGLENPSYYKRIKESLRLLSKTNYTFVNSLYSNVMNGVLNQEIISPIMTIRIITRKDNDAKRVDYFEDGRVKEVYEITITEHFYSNIVAKGYLAFDSEKLLSIENSIARSIYTMIEKWRCYDLYIKRPVFFIARRIPLKWNKTQIKRTIDTIEKAMVILENTNLIKSYKIIKEKKWELAEIEITFDEGHNKTKRETFFDEKDDFKNFDMIVTDTEERRKDSEENEDILAIINVFPERVRVMKTIESFITDSVKKHNYDYVKNTAEYTVMNNPKNYKSYMAQALEKNWADEYISKKQMKEKKLAKEESIETIEEAVVINKYSYEDFEKYPEEQQKEIIDKVYKKFLAEANSEDNLIMKNIFKKSNKGLIVQYINENEIIKNIETSEEKIKVETNVKVEKFENEYVSITKFILEVSRIAKEYSIEFNIDEVAPIFKNFGEFEDENIKIDYNAGTKIGKIEILGGNNGNN